MTELTPLLVRELHRIANRHEQRADTLALAVDERDRYISQLEQRIDELLAHTPKEQEHAHIASRS